MRGLRCVATALIALPGIVGAQNYNFQYTDSANNAVLAQGILTVDPVVNNIMLAGQP